MLLRVDGRLENSKLPTDTIHRLTLPGRYPLTRLIILFELVNCGHAGPSYNVKEDAPAFLDNSWHCKCETFHR